MKNSDDEKKPPSKFAVENKKNMGNKLSAIQEKSSLNRDDEV